MGGTRGKTVGEAKERQIVEALKDVRDAQVVAEKFEVSVSKVYDIAQKNEVELHYKRKKTPGLEGQPGPEEGTPEYTHHQEMLSLVKTWSKELDVWLYRHPIMLDDFSQMDLHRSVDPTGESPDLLWDNRGEKLVVRLPYEVDTDGDIKRARKNLYQHLGAGPSPTLLDQMPEWTRVAASGLVLRSSLLGGIEHGLKEGFAYHQDLGSLEADSKRWYIGTIVASWVDYADNRLDYGEIEEDDDTGVYEVRYGKFIIIRATDLERVKALLAIHQLMINAPEVMVDAFVNNVGLYRRHKQLLASLTEAIQKRLDSLLQVHRIRGRCRACP